MFFENVNFFSVSVFKKKAQGKVNIRGDVDLELLQADMLNYFYELQLLSALLFF